MGPVAPLIRLRHSQPPRCSKKIMKDLIKPVAASLKERHLIVKDAQVLSEISKAKAREETPEAMLAKGTALGPKGEIAVIMAHVGSGGLMRGPARG